jgi:hypothetical protein
MRKGRSVTPAMGATNSRFSSTMLPICRVMERKVARAGLLKNEARL